jgi:hypothetical protein
LLVVPAQIEERALLLDKQFAGGDLHDLEIAPARSHSYPKAVLTLMGLCGHVTPFQAMFQRPRFAGCLLPCYSRPQFGHRKGKTIVVAPRSGIAPNPSCSLSTAVGSMTHSTMARLPRI